jgi:uncharacterized membrane protein
MSFRFAGLLLSVFVGCLGAILLGCGFNTADVKLRSVEYKGMKLQILDNSETLSAALAINSGGSIIGQKEVPSEDKTIFSNVYFYCNKLKSKDMPIPKGFSNIEAVALSDNNRVVGRATRAIGAKDGSLRAVVWDPEASDEVQLLPRAEDDIAGDAQDISADGLRVTGYSTGPERMRPTLWSWDKKQEKWSVTILPTLHENNPYLMSSQLIVSPDGKTIVGCCTESFRPDGSVDSGLFVWRDKDGKWERSLVTSEQMYVKAINNKGQIAGSVAEKHGRMPCLVTLDGKIKMLELLPGDVSGEARDINENSDIVGWSDDPHGPEGGPAPCRWNTEGKATPVEISESGYGSIHSINEAGQVAGMIDLVVAGEDNKPENEKVMVLAFRSLK